MPENGKKLSLEEIDVALGSADEKHVWEAAEALGEYAELNPDAIWPLVVKHGSSVNDEVRSAIATCVLEHILQYHFDRYFPLVENIIRSGNQWFAKTFQICWKFGFAERPANAKRWDELLTRIRELESNPR